MPTKARIFLLLPKTNEYLAHKMLLMHSFPKVKALHRSIGKVGGLTEMVDAADTLGDDLRSKFLM